MTGISEPGRNVEKRTYTVCEIAEILNISKSAAYTWIRDNLDNPEFRILRIGGLIRVTKESFDKWLYAS